MPTYMRLPDTLARVIRRFWPGEVEIRAAAPQIQPPAQPLPGAHVTEGAALAANQPEPVNPRSQRGAVIRVLTTNRGHFNWQFNCSHCGENNFVAVGDENRETACGACKHPFSIRGLAAEAIQSARRAAKISADLPLSAAEWDAWRFSLPERIPSAEGASPTDQLAQRGIRVTGTLGDNPSGEVQWVGETQPYTEGFGGKTVGFDGPRSCSPEWMERRKAAAEQERRTYGSRK